MYIYIYIYIYTNVANVRTYMHVDRQTDGHAYLSFAKIPPSSIRYEVCMKSLSMLDLQLP